MKSLTLVTISVFALTNLLVFSGCTFEDDLEELANAITILGGGMYSQSGFDYYPQLAVPYFSIDSIEHDTLSNYILWMSARFYADSTLILKDFMVNYWEAETQVPETLTKVFEVEPDTIDFGTVPNNSFSFSASFDSLKFETSYMFCLVERNYSIINSAQAGSIPGSCGTLLTR